MSEGTGLLNQSGKPQVIHVSEIDAFAYRSNEIEEEN